MASFTGTMRIEGGGSAVPVKAVVGEESLILEVEGTQVGEWPVLDLDPRVDAGGVVLRLGDEHVILDVSDRTGFLGVLTPPPGKRRKKRRGSRRRRRRLSWRVVAAIVLAGSVGVAALVAPEVVGSVALVVGLLALVLGALAHSDPRIALRLPVGLHSIHVIVAGLVVLAGGVALVLVG